MEKLESLEGGATFFGRPSFGIPAGEQTKMVANSVYYFPLHGRSPKFLVYGDGEGKKCELSLSSNHIYCQTAMAYHDISPYIYIYIYIYIYG